MFNTLNIKTHIVARFRISINANILFNSNFSSFFFSEKHHIQQPVPIIILFTFLLSGDLKAQVENNIFNSHLTTAIELNNLKPDSHSNIRSSEIYSPWMIYSTKFKSAEFNHSYISDYSPITGKNILGLTSLNYFKNNEYSEYHNPGETFLGTQLILGLNNVNLKHKERYFKESKNSNRSNLLKSSLNLGLLLNYYYGGNQAQLFPLMNIQYFFKKSHFTFGSLNSNTNHRLLEALYNYEFTFTRPIEYGLEYRKYSRFLDFNSWLEFRQLAIRKTSQQEIIAFGNRFNFKVIPAKLHNTGRLSIPIQTIVYHKGGEALAVGKPISTLFNYAAGLKYTSNRNFWNAELFYLSSNDISPGTLKTLKNGHAVLFNTSIHFNNHLNLVISYFNGYNFSSPLGAKLFTNEYVAINDSRSHRRELIQTRIIYSKRIPNSPSIIDFRVEPIYIMDRNQIAFSTGLYFKYIIGNYIY